MKNALIVLWALLGTGTQLTAQPTSEDFDNWKVQFWDPIESASRYKFVYHEPTRMLGFLFPETWPGELSIVGRLFTVGTIEFNQDIDWDISDAVFNNGWSDRWTLEDQGVVLSFAPINNSTYLPPTADQGQFWPGFTNAPPPSYAAQLPDTLMPIARLPLGQTLTPDMVVRTELAFVDDPSLFVLPLDFDVVPEPSTLGIMGAGVMMICRRWRTRKSG